MFRNSVGGDELEKNKKEIVPKFHHYILQDITQPKLTSKVASYNHNLKQRCKVQVLGVDKCVPSSITRKEDYGSDGNLVLVVFALAKNQEEQFALPEKIKNMAQVLRGYRIVYVTTPEITFCSNNQNLWDEYVEQLAYKQLAGNDEQAKSIRQSILDKMGKEWLERLTTSNAKLQIYCSDSEGDIPYIEERTWGKLGDYLEKFIQDNYRICVDKYSGSNQTAMGKPTDLQNWALAGMPNTNVKGACKTMQAVWEKLGIQRTSAWFTNNPQHPLTQMRDFCKEKLNNALRGRGICSIRKIYIDLQKAANGGLLYVPYSAMVLGFVLHEWLTDKRMLQWTNGMMTSRLDAGTLAEIIETVVHNNGASKINGEKEICLLSKEEKEFVKQSGEIFGCSINPDVSVETALETISSHLTQISDNIPLWIL